MKKDINYALVEDKRPPLYTCMKYWGKKPHNIWREYISNYTSNGLFLDPFCGSAMSAFESFVAGKKTFACDLNPLSSFVIEVVSSDFDEKVFTSEVEKIIATIFDNQTYKKLYRYLGNDYIVHNVKYNEDIPYEISLVDVDGKNKKCILPSKIDMDVIELSKELIINKKYPTAKINTTIKHNYKNMRTYFDKDKTAIEAIVKAYKAAERPAGPAPIMITSYKLFINFTFFFCLSSSYFCFLCSNFFL